MIRALPLSIALTSVACVAQGENWPCFRGPSRQGISSETNLPLKWSASENVRWKTSVPGESWASPIVWNDRIFVSTATEDGTSPPDAQAQIISGAGDVVQGFDAATGERLWSSKNIGEGIVPTIVLGDGVAFSASGLYCLENPQIAK
jgi:outer membrane protein assembly factor BamB